MILWGGDDRVIAHCCQGSRKDLRNTVVDNRELLQSMGETISTLTAEVKELHKSRDDSRRELSEVKMMLQMLCRQQGVEPPPTPTRAAVAGGVRTEAGL